MGLLLWSIVLLAAIFASHWGADKLSAPLEKLKVQGGFSEAAGAAFVALATASPEIGTNTASALKGLSDIGLGNLLGSNIISVPAIVTVSYLAAQTRSPAQNDRTQSDRAQPPQIERGETSDALASAIASHQFTSWQALQVGPEALTVQAIPYLAVIALAALLTIPQPWRGLQPLDGWIMLAAYPICVGQALLRKRQQSRPVRWRRTEIIIAIAGVLALSMGAYFVIAATEKIIAILGISQLIGGLFITSTLSIAPEVFATWSIARSGQFTTATTSVIADNTVTMTLAFFPLALAGVPIQDSVLFAVNLAFVALLAIVYAAFIRWGKKRHSFELWEVGVLLGIYVAYVTIMVLFIL